MSSWLEPHAGPARLALGCMNFGRRTPERESGEILARAVDAGIGLLDTANVYNDGASERIVGRFARGREVLVASKVGLAPVGGRPEGLAPDVVVAACEASLRRLGRDTIDVYYLHAPDPHTPIEETLDAVARLVQAGKVRAWGMSNFASWQILEARHIATRLDLAPPAVAQQLYNVLVRQLDVEYFRFAERYPLHTTIYNPLAGGLLARRLDLEADAPKGSRFANPMYRRRYWHRALFAAVEDLRGIAEGAGLSLVDLAYGYVRGHAGVHSVLVGPATVAHLDAALASPISLAPDVVSAVDQVYTELVGTDARYAR